MAVVSVVGKREREEEDEREFSIEKEGFLTSIL